MSVQIQSNPALRQHTAVMMIALLLSSLLLCGVPSSASAKRHDRVRPQDEVWFLSSRGLRFPRDTSDCEVPLKVKRYDPAAGWTKTTIAEFRNHESMEEDAIVLFYFHGNRKDQSKSFSDGWMAYRRLVKQTNPDRPVKFVIFSWPSERQQGPYRDVKAKAGRVRIDAFYLGWLLSCMDSETPMSFVGHSYGAQIIVGGLHVSMGGRLCGKTVDTSKMKSVSSVRVVLMSAALHNYWMKSGQKHDHAYLRINQMLNVYNPCDPILKWYPWLDRCNMPQAMGRSGVAGLRQLEDGGKRIKQINASYYIGCSHFICDYLGSRSLINKMARVIFWEPVETRD